MPVLLMAILLLAGCDDTALDPFEESDLHFSIGGYLDGGVDTQFVRITPVRDSIALGPDPLDAVVTLEHLATGTTTVLNDSIFSYQGAGSLTASVAHNFWSTEPLEPLATYRLTVTGPDRAESRATVTLPDTFPDPVIAGNTIRMRRIERLADVVVAYRMREMITGKIVTYAVSYLPRVVPTQDGFEVFIDRAGDENEVAARFLIARLEVLTIQVTVAAAGPDWPDLTAVEDETLALPTVVTNVESGVGYLGGIISKTIPWPGFEE
jgi:hypothetical protein